MDIQDRAISQKFEERYRNKNLNILPTQMLVALSTLSTLDISYNQLTDSQIELIMNSCTKLSTFCIQGNVTNLIPASVSKLKLLVNFRHDWVKLNPDDMY
jgi:Leucine-rich repeat (LRR) protein